MAHQTEKTILLALLLMVVPVAASVADAEQSTNMGERVDFKDFLMSISMIGLSEIGDKTFLIAALMAMRHPRLLVFSAAATSLAIMTIISGVVGHSIVSFLSCLLYTSRCV